ncbi:MAG TPA: hypothetical protein VGN81_41590 [Pseudonocardiaceae bacterium]
MRADRRRQVRLLIAVLVAGVAVVSCTGEGPAETQAQQKSEQLQQQVYQQHNNVEFQNYNQRQKISDDPATILWCTAYPTNPNAKPLTFPIKGKLTSSNKRPYPTSVAENGGDGSTYTPEVPGPDSMYGASAEYRYGFTPAGDYVDFTGMETICTTQPTVYQKQQTDIVLQTDSGLVSASAQAKAALQAGDPAKANQILEQAIGGQ